jgi:Ser/Thr protein kinase RdoA (MazF antagonist)
MCCGATAAPHVVDLDDAMQGPAVQDLWMLVSGDHASMAQQLNTLLQGYEQFAEFDDRQRALIEPLRTLRMLRHSAWLAARWGDPTFPLNFPFFGTAAYWSQQTTQRAARTDRTHALRATRPPPDTVQTFLQTVSKRFTRCT